MGFEAFAGDTFAALDTVPASGKSDDDGPSPLGLDSMLASGTEEVPGSMLSSFTLACGSFCPVGGFEDGFGRTGTTGLIEALLVTLR